MLDDDVALVLQTGISGFEVLFSAAHPDHQGSIEKITEMVSANSLLEEHRFDWIDFETLVTSVCSLEVLMPQTDNNVAGTSMA